MPRSPESRFRGAVAGLIESGVAVRASTAELWANIRAELTDKGVESIPNAWQVVNELRSEAAARRTGYERFQRAPMEAEFTRAFAAADPNVRAEADFALLPRYLARFDLTFIGPDGEQTTKTVSARDYWFPGMTVGDVHDMVADAAEGLTNKYGGELVAWGNIRPVRI